MRNIDKFYDIWCDLDKSYEKYKAPLKVETKAAYLKKLCLSNNGEDMLLKILVLLDKESSQYSEEDFEKLSIIRETITAIKSIIDKVDYSADIVSLNALIVSAINDLPIGDNTSSLKVEDLLSTTSNVKVKYMTSKDMYKKLKRLVSHSIKNRYKVTSFIIKENFNNDFITISPDTMEDLDFYLNTGGSNGLALMGKELYPNISKIVGFECGRLSLTTKKNVRAGKVLSNECQLLHSAKDLSIYFDSNDGFVIIVI